MTFRLWRLTPQFSPLGRGRGEGGYGYTKLYKNRIRVILTEGSFSPRCLGLVNMCHVMGVCGGVWKESGRCLGVVWMTVDTVWGYDVQAIDKQPILFEFISCFIFSQWTRNGQKVS